jgi:hypothetical protein
MANVKIKLTWTKSASLDVVAQHLIAVLSPLGGGSGTTAEFDLGPNVQSFQRDVPENTAVSVQLRAKDAAGNFSEPATLDFETGDDSAPLPPTNLAFEVVEDGGSNDNDDDVSGPGPD